MDNARDHMLTHTSAAGAMYDVPEDLISEVQEQMPRGVLARVPYAAGRINAHLVHIAETHHAECDRTACRTCDEIREALAVMLAFVRADLDEEMRGMYGGRRWPWTRA